MTPRDYLEGPNRIRREICRKQSRIDNLRRLSLNLSPMLQKEKIRAAPDPTRIQTLLAGIADGEQEILRLQEVLARAMIERALYISVLQDQNEYLVLESRYVYGFGWEETADRMLYTMSRTFHLHSDALSHLPPPPEEDPSP